VKKQQTVAAYPAQMTMDTEIHITHHARKRAKERLSWNFETLKRMAEKAFTEGVRTKDLAARLRRYVDSKGIIYKSTGCIYGEVIYHFRDKALCTVLLIPREFRPYLRHYKR